MKVTKILLVAMLSCMLFAGCKATDIGKEAGVAMEKATYRQVSMEEAMELMETGSGEAGSTWLYKHY